MRPWVTGIYSDIDQRFDPVDRVGVSITPDTRYQSVADHDEDSQHPGRARDGRQPVGAVPAGRAAGQAGAPAGTTGWWRPTLRDVTVIGVLGAWAVIGPATSDDGYILGIARARESAGYIGNYYRWFNVPEAPFGWFYELYAAVIHVSDSRARGCGCRR